MPGVDNTNDTGSSSVLYADAINAQTRFAGIRADAIEHVADKCPVQVRVFGNITSSNISQTAKASCPILFTDLPMVTFCRL